jgi:hypothetical protein
MLGVIPPLACQPVLQRLHPPGVLGSVDVGLQAAVPRLAELAAPDRVQVRCLPGCRPWRRLRR